MRPQRHGQQARPPPATRTAAAARWLSIAGHPALVMPLAVPLAAARRGATWQALAVAAVLAAAIAAIVGGYSWWQVRAGRWTHVDASVPRERRHLNLFVVALLLSSAGALRLAGEGAALVIGLSLAAGIVAAALVLQRWLKVSMHAAFAAFAAALLWPGTGALAFGVLALGVGWSRLRLGRHDTAEVVVGLLLGCAAGVVSHAAAASAGSP